MPIQSPLRFLLFSATAFGALGVAGDTPPSPGSSPASATPSSPQVSGDVLTFSSVRALLALPESAVATLPDATSIEARGRDSFGDGGGGGFVIRARKPPDEDNGGTLRLLPDGRILAWQGGDLLPLEIFGTDDDALRRVNHLPPPTKRRITLTLHRPLQIRSVARLDEFRDIQFQGRVTVDQSREADACLHLAWPSPEVREVRSFAISDVRASTTGDWSSTGAENIPARPTLVISGYHNGQLSVGRVDYVEFRCDGDDPLSAGMAWNHIRIGRANRVSIHGSGKDPAWFNENLVSIGSCVRLFDMSGPYAHNGNVFSQMGIEAGAAFRLESGSSNLFRLRGENHGPLTLGPRARFNDITLNYLPDLAALFEPPAVQDAGFGNQVHYLPSASLPVSVLTELRGEPAIVEQFAGEGWRVAGPLAGPGFALAPYQTLWDSGIVPAEGLAGLKLSADAPLFRLVLNLYDAAGQEIQPSDPGRLPISNEGRNWGYFNGALRFSVDAADQLTLILRPDVAKIRIRVESGSRAGTATRATLKALYRPATAFASFVSVPHPDRRAPTLAQLPRRLNAPVGTVFSVHGADDYVVIHRESHTLAKSANAQANKVVVHGKAVGAKEGDILGIALSSGATHWTTVQQVAGRSLTLADSLPSPAEEDAAIVAVRYAPIR